MQRLQRSAVRLRIQPDVGQVGEGVNRRWSSSPAERAGARRPIKDRRQVPGLVQDRDVRMSVEQATERHRAGPAHANDDRHRRWAGRRTRSPRIGSSGNAHASLCFRWVKSRIGIGAAMVASTDHGQTAARRILPLRALGSCSTAPGQRHIGARPRSVGTAWWPARRHPPRSRAPGRSATAATPSTPC